MLKLLIIWVSVFNVELQVPPKFGLTNDSGVTDEWKSANVLMRDLQRLVLRLLRDFHKYSLGT